MGSSTNMNTGSNGSHHHHLHHHNQRGSSGRSYGLMLLLAFGAAILGVIILHKLREGRLFSLLVKEKDHELLSLHFLLQREREYNKEARKKIQDLNTKLNSLRNEKMEIDHRLSGTEYMLASMTEDHKALESQLDEKQQEIEKLRSGITTTATADQEKQQHQRIFERMETDTEDVLQQQQQQQQPGVTQKVWSVSSDDPSSNAQAAAEQSGGEEEEEEKNLENSGSQRGFSSGKNNTTHENVNEVSQGSTETTISSTKGGQMMRRDGEETETGSQNGSDLEKKLLVPLEKSSISSSREGKWREIINTKLQKNGYSEEHGEEVEEEAHQVKRNDDEEIETTDSDKKHPAEQNDSFRGSKWRGIISTRLQKHGYFEEESERKENEDVASSRRRKRMRNRFSHILKPRKNHNSKGETTAATDQDNRSSGGDEQQQRQMHNVMIKSGEEIERKKDQLNNHTNDQASVATLDEKKTVIADQEKGSVAKKGKKEDSSSIEEDQHQNSDESGKEEDFKDPKASGGGGGSIDSHQSSEAAAHYESNTRGTDAGDEMEDLFDEHDQYKSKEETETY